MGRDFPVLSAVTDTKGIFHYFVFVFFFFSSPEDGRAGDVPKVAIPWELLTGNLASSLPRLPDHIIPAGKFPAKKRHEVADSANRPPVAEASGQTGLFPLLLLRGCAYRTPDGPAG